MKTLMRMADTCGHLFGRRPSHPIRKHSRRLEIDWLEDRTVPAVLNVNSPADNLVADARLTLREAILLVDQGGNAKAALGRNLTAGERAQTRGALGKGDRIQFTSALDRATIVLRSQIVISRSVILDASTNEHLTIDGNNRSRIFKIDNGKPQKINVSIYGSSYTRPLLTHGSVPGGNGGAILNSENLVLWQAAIWGNQASNGGSIYNTGSLHVTGYSEIHGNAETGGAIYNTGKLVVDHGYFQDGGATRGGILANVGRGTASINDSTFSGNTASGVGGGAIYNTGKLNLQSSNFSNNTAANGNGGAIHNTGGGSAVIGGTTTLSIARNQALGGGAIFNDVGCTIVASASASAQPTFSGNSAPGGFGGAILNRGSLYLNGPFAFLENQAPKGGGALANLGGLVSVNGSVFVNNATQGLEGGGGALHNTGQMYVNLCTLSGNRSAGNGGGIANLGGLTVLESTIRNNRADFDGDGGGSGGGIFAFSSEPTNLHNATVEDNFVGLGQTEDNLSGGPFITY